MVSRSGRGRLALVTGGAGFIGSHVVDELLAAGWQVRSLDLLHPLAHASEPEYLNPAAEHVWGDVRDRAVVEAALEGVDAVSHQAAMVGLGVKFADAPDYVSHNLVGTATLLAAMHQAGTVERAVLASSMVVYGEGRYRCRAHGAVNAPAPRRAADLDAGDFDPRCERCGGSLAPASVPESAPLDPRNVYAATKLNQEQLCAAFTQAGGCEFVSLRYHNVFGPRMPRDTPYAGVAAIFRSSLAAGRAPRVFEDGCQQRDFVHVRDVALANRLALEAGEGLGCAFNIGSGRPRSIGEMAGALATAMDGPEPDVTGDYRLGDVRHVFASIERARVELGYAPQVGFAEGIAEFAAAELRESVAAISG